MPLTSEHNIRKELLADPVVSAIIKDANECLAVRDAMLLRVARQLRFYERNHLIKADNKTAKAPAQEEARQKAKVNGDLAAEIEAILAENE